MENLKIGDKVTYKDIEGKKDQTGVIKEVKVSKIDGEVMGYIVLTDDGVIRGCSENDLVKTET